MSPAEPPANVTPTHAARGYVVSDLARRYRVGEDRVRAWIKAGELRAISTASARCGKPRYVVPPEALAAFEAGRAAAAPQLGPTRRRRRAAEVDYFPD